MGMNYKMGSSKPQTRVLELEMTIDKAFFQSNGDLIVQLPDWRPGRYELGNFAKNILHFEPRNENNEVLAFQKTGKSSWLILTNGSNSVQIKYGYYAAVLDAGSCWVDSSQIYVNPVHCCLYIPGYEQTPCTLQIEIPSHFEIAGSLKRIGHNQFEAKDFHELVDSPFIASPSLQHHSYLVGNTTFHLWFQGECKLDWNRIIPDFEKFTQQQMTAMGGFPTTEYHFLFQILTTAYYHGVEHLKSTVIVLGPSYNLMKPVLYPELLGISSHELYHSWNIKTIRPIEMMPYQYNRENFSRLGYVAEGITTYYGDLFLHRSGSFTTYEMMKELTRHIQKHLDNYGRFNLSVGSSSWDTWLDGYVEGIPHRKVSIYTEGALCAFMVDILIRRNTGNRNSLDDVMEYLYNEFGKKGIGYSESDYKQALERFGETDFTWFFKDYYNGTVDYEPLLADCLDYIGYQINKVRSRMYFENRFGFKIKFGQNGASIITSVAPNSLSEKAGLSKDDMITGINGIKLENNLKEWCKYFAEETITLEVYSQNQFKQVMLVPNESDRYFQLVNLQQNADLSPEQKYNLRQWSKSLTE
ncbi:MAG: PDZ domain-containing protein [Bacteroidia bacterium]|nr:PDZ domain-containing protein [Bacteroidia bacterium]